MEIKVQNNNHLFTKAVWAIRTQGEDSASGNSQVNNDATRFIDEVFSATVANPRDRWLSVPGRNSSALAAIGETFWVLAGRNDVEFMQRLLPKNAGKFSDDGVTWRAAYGPRIYAHGQLDSVIDRLRKNPNTRQAYLTLYDPALDSDQGLEKSHPEGKAVTKDMVCNFALAFNIKDNKLNMTVFNRSQDVLWGMSTINFIEFSILQEIVANILEVDLGVYRLVSNNLHFYYNEVSQKQLSKVNVDAGVVEHESSRIIFRDVKDQNDIVELFGGLVQLMEDGNSWDDVVHHLNYFGANDGLIRDMACVLWHRLKGKLMNLDYVKDVGLKSALFLNERKHLVGWEGEE
ncbi:thymidylate synthase [Erwinia phage phiEa2809]|uniref:Thymidylate synthase n=1 Tax=Erwinia phage phiEa2809 TaxID=1564096 RepID=A0A0A0YS43_9CAUD|nr:thymidylate synthase [Erwinia phage phiEa2809]AIX13049.1 thymidylate synthase [Erwinia phage phiEa2809]